MEALITERFRIFQHIKKYKVMKQVRTLRKEQLIKDLYWIEKKRKHDKSWDENVKTAFQSSGSFSFEELILKNAPAAEQLVTLFK
jgi:hypothetical protein